MELCSLVGITGVAKNHLAPSFRMEARGGILRQNIDNRLLDYSLSTQITLKSKQ